MALGLFDDVGEVSAPTVFHEDVHNPCIAVHVSVDVSYNVLVVKVFENVPRIPRVLAATGRRQIGRAHV